ncbi:uncharacterized protein LOC122948402 isoform X1 [Acropora millepora]|uniref:uncharacterized protein LOC122948402 isoform X1 n=1 Tax=Acropora millepora TaxID=45264 RepID=UPI001CF1D329|nr:uncharacterized protein LOC122948402 isoform X1 [Acropora millepora]
MGNTCSCRKKTFLSDSNPKFCAEKTRTTADSGPRECPSTVMVKANSTKEVTNSENQKVAHAEVVKEYKVFPPIRKTGDTLPHISYRPNSVWGGSVHSFLATVNQDSDAIDDLITGRRRKSQSIGPLLLTNSELRRHSKDSGGWKRESFSIECSAEKDRNRKRRLSNSKESSKITNQS